MLNHSIRPSRRRAPVSRFVHAALAGDRTTAIKLAVDFMAEKRSRATVITDLFHGAQLQIGNRWHMGLATAADEFRVSTAIVAAMVALPSPTVIDAVKAPSRILLATLWPERHDLGVRLVGTALRDDGWVVDFAHGVEPVELVNRAAQARMSLVGISSTFLVGQARAQLDAVVRSLHAIGVAVIVGGAAFVRAPRLAEEIGADSSAADARSAVIVARRIQNGHRRLLSQLRVLPMFIPEVLDHIRDPLGSMLG